MRVEHRDGTQERRILTGMIVDTPLLGHIAAQWPADAADGLFRSRYANTVAGWCVRHYGKYSKAPGAAIEGIAEAWAANGRDKDTVTLINKFLGGLSDDYTAAKEAYSTEYLTDLAGDYFNTVRLQQLAEGIQDDIAAGRAKEAHERQALYNRVELGVGAGIDVLQDHDAIRDAFEDQTEPLVRYPGALGKFINPALERDAFIAFLGSTGVGKCVAADMEVPMYDGTVKTIREIVEGKIRTPVAALDETRQQIVPMRVSEFWDNGTKPCYRVVTKTTRSAIVTGNHKFLTPDGWKDLFDIRVGEFIAVPRRVPIFGTERMIDDEVKFLAYMMADGCCRGQPTFTKTDPTILADFEATCDALAVTYIRRDITHALSNALPLVRKFGIDGHKATTKTIPECVYKTPRDQVALFLRVFFTCDASVLKRDNGRCGHTIELTLANERLTRQIGHLLHRFGIVHTITYRKNKQRDDLHSWRLTIASQEHVNLYLSKIGFMSYKHREITPDVPQKSLMDSIPWQIAARMYAELEQSYPNDLAYSLKPGGGYYRPGYAMRADFGRSRANNVRSKIRQKRRVLKACFAGVRNHQVCKKYLDGDVLWDKVVSLKPVGNRATYDLSIPKHHNFVANDVFVHNTWLLIDLAWRAMEQRLRVAFFEVGDLSQRQLMRRFMIRCAKHPRRPGRIWLPRALTPGEDYACEVDRYPKDFEQPLSWQRAAKAADRVMRLRVKSKRPYLKCSCHPAGSINVSQIADILQGWERQGWVADCILIDYADELAPQAGYTKERRDQITATWTALRGLSQRTHTLVATATQADAKSYTAHTLRRGNFSDDRRKLDKVTAMFAINQTEAEKAEGLWRLNIQKVRDMEYNELRVCHVAGSLAIGNPCMRSCLWVPSNAD